MSFLALMRFALLDHIGRNVVEKICEEVEVGAVSVAVGRLGPSSRGPGNSPHSPGVSSGAGIIALTKTSMRTGTRSQTRGAVNPPSDCATRIAWRVPMAAGLDERGPGSHRGNPFSHGPGDELGTVVGTDMARDATQDEEVRQDVDDIGRLQSPVDPDRQAPS